MPETIKIGGFNATNREKERLENEKDSSAKKTTTKKPKPASPKKAPAKKETKAKERKTTKKVTTKKTAESEITKEEVMEKVAETENLPSQVNSDITVGDDGKTRIDLSEALGPGMFAEVDEDVPPELVQEIKDNAVKSVIGEDPVPVEVPTPNVENNDNKSEDSNEEIPEEILAYGNPKSYAYLSLKATGLNNPDIISLALITEDSKVFYAEFPDVDIMKITPAVLSNVIHKKFNVKEDEIIDGRTSVCGDINHIRAMLLKWIKEEFTDKGHIMQIVSDKVLNEFALFMDFLTNGVPLENYALMVSPVCVDVNTILANNIDISPDGMNKDEFLANYIPAYIASGVSRYNIVEDTVSKEYIGNAIVNAQLTRKVFRKLTGFDKNDPKPDNQQ